MSLLSFAVFELLGYSPGGKSRSRASLCSTTPCLGVKECTAHCVSHFIVSRGCSTMIRPHEPRLGGIGGRYGHPKGKLGIVHCARSAASPSLAHQWQAFANSRMHVEIPRKDLVAA